MTLVSDTPAPSVFPPAAPSTAAAFEVSAWFRALSGKYDTRQYGQASFCRNDQYITTSSASTWGLLLPKSTWKCFANNQSIRAVLHPGPLEEDRSNSLFATKVVPARLQLGYSKVPL
ncbi:hypothetical protein SIIN_7476_T [Serendipita indica DSM 11827]|nr:hypothetical protein SIIN_7476_T [Serendipita indica DSM 11827]